MLKIAPQTRLGVQCVVDENENKDWKRENCLGIFVFKDFFSLGIYKSTLH